MLMGSILSQRLDYRQSSILWRDVLARPHNDVIYSTRCICTHPIIEPRPPTPPAGAAAAAGGADSSTGSFINAIKSPWFSWMRASSVGLCCPIICKTLDSCVGSRCTKRFKSLNCGWPRKSSSVSIAPAAAPGDCAGAAPAWATYVRKATETVRRCASSSLQNRVCEPLNSKRGFDS